jgi:hypothetical protein
VTVRLDDTIFALWIFPELDDQMGAVYLRVSGHIDRRHFIDGLHGKGGGKAARDPEILEIGFYEPSMDYGP